MTEVNVPHKADGLNGLDVIEMIRAALDVFADDDVEAVDFPADAHPWICGIPAKQVREYNLEQLRAYVVFQAYCLEIALKQAREEAAQHDAPEQVPGQMSLFDYEEPS